MKLGKAGRDEHEEPPMGDKWDEMAYDLHAKVEVAKPAENYGRPLIAAALRAAHAEGADASAARIAELEAKLSRTEDRCDEHVAHACEIADHLDAGDGESAVMAANRVMQERDALRVRLAKAAALLKEWDMPCIPIDQDPSVWRCEWNKRRTAFLAQSEQEGKR